MNAGGQQSPDDTLYTLLPAIYRMRDELQPDSPLRTLLQVIASQARRKFINALPEANQPVWDYQASTDDTHRFVRRGSARVTWPVRESAATLSAHR